MAAFRMDEAECCAAFVALLFFVRFLVNSKSAELDRISERRRRALEELNSRCVVMQCPPPDDALQGTRAAAEMDRGIRF